MSATSGIGVGLASDFGGECVVEFGARCGPRFNAELNAVGSFVGSAIMIELVICNTGPFSMANADGECE